MEKNKNEEAADMSFHKIQRGAAIAAGTDGYLGGLPEKEIDRRMAIYTAIMNEFQARGR
jgi:hypothetical protein